MKVKAIRGVSGYLDALLWNFGSRRCGGEAVTATSGEAEVRHCLRCGRTLLIAPHLRLFAKVSRPEELDEIFSYAERWLRGRGDEASASEVRRLAASVPEWKDEA